MKQSRPSTSLAARALSAALPMLLLASGCASGPPVPPWESRSETSSGTVEVRIVSLTETESGPVVEGRVVPASWAVITWEQRELREPGAGEGKTERRNEASTPGSWAPRELRLEAPGLPATVVPVAEDGSFSASLAVPPEREPKDNGLGFSLEKKMAVRYPVSGLVQAPASLPSNVTWRVVDPAERVLSFTTTDIDEELVSGIARDLAMAGATELILRASAPGVNGILRDADVAVRVLEVPDGARSSVEERVRSGLRQYGYPMNERAASLQATLDEVLGGLASTGAELHGRDGLLKALAPIGTRLVVVAEHPEYHRFESEPLTVDTGGQFRRLVQMDKREPGDEETVGGSRGSLLRR